MKKGIITIYDMTSGFMFTRNYYSMKHRAELLDFIKKLYGRQWSNMSYSITPSISLRDLEKIELPTETKAA